MFGLLPQITVLMPVRDGSRWIAEAISSVLAQSFGDFELVVVDDGSVDATPAILHDLASSDPRIVVISQASLGVVASLNAGLRAARAPLIARLDADDFAEPHRLAEQFAAMQRDCDIVLLGSWAREIDEVGRVIGARRPETDPAKLKFLLASGNPMIHPAVMFRTAAARAAGGYRAAFAAAEDYDLWLRLAVRGRVVNLSQELIRYRVHGDSVSARERLQQLFSTRLAQRSASLRNDGADDPLADRDLALAPSGEAPAAYADISRLYRFLSWSDSARPPGAMPALPPRQELSRLSRRERRMAQHAILRVFAAEPKSVSATMVWEICKLRPLRALPMLWRLWTTRTNGKI